MSREPHIRKVRPDDLEEAWRVASDPDGYFCAVEEGLAAVRPPRALPALGADPLLRKRE